MKAETCTCEGGHADQLTKYPLGTEIKTLCIMRTVNPWVIPKGSEGHVIGHCDDGRALIRFRFDNSVHSFHHPEGYVEVLPPRVYETQYCECCGHEL